MQAHRFRAPSTDGALLAVPPLEDAPRALDESADRLSSWQYDFQGRSAARLRNMVRQQVLARSREFLAAHGQVAPVEDPGNQAGRLVVTGHQPELYHPGVWIKNFAASEITRRTPAAAVNIIVDNDIAKSNGVRVPGRDGRDGEVSAVRVDFDAWHGDVPYEDHKVADESIFDSFELRVVERLSGLIDDPLVSEFWPKAREARRYTDRLGLRLALARRSVETSWGVRNFDIPLSSICETEGFLWFACHLIAQLPRFQSIHNKSLESYRKLYGIRSHHHPVPDLAQRDGWIEAPFWVWRAGSPRRRPLLVRPEGRQTRLRISGENDELMVLPLSADREACCAVEELTLLPAQGVRLRTRALTTTMFARYLLGDLFLHGIGGAKYDELGDEIARRFFGIEPTPYFTLSLTLWLGLDFDPGAGARLEALDRAERDLLYNPDRHLDPAVLADPEVSRWVAAKRDAILGPAESHPQRLERFHTIRRCNEALRDRVASIRDVLDAERQRLLPEVRRAALARSREYALVVHSRKRLREAFRHAVSIPGEAAKADAGESAAPS